MCWSTFIVDMIDVNKTLYCISVVKISYSVLMVTIVSCITPRFLDSSHFPRSRGLWQCWSRFFCYTVSWSYYSVKCRLRISWLSDEDCAVSQNPNREGRLHFMTTKGFDHDLMRHYPGLRIDPVWRSIINSISRFRDFNNFKFFRTEACNIKAPWFTSISVLIVSNSGSQRVRLLVYAPINTDVICAGSIWDCSLTSISSAAACMPSWYIIC